MSKPKKTILQLETLIKKEAATSMLLPKDIVVSIWPDSDGWKVACRSPHPLQDRECCELNLVRTEADRLRLKFDLNL
jgi:hypothetical protein